MYTLFVWKYLIAWNEAFVVWQFLLLDILKDYQRQALLWLYINNRACVYSYDILNFLSDFESYNSYKIILITKSVTTLFFTKNNIWNSKYLKYSTCSILIQPLRISTRPQKGVKAKIKNHQPNKLQYLHFLPNLKDFFLFINSFHSSSWHLTLSRFTGASLFKFCSTSTISEKQRKRLFQKLSTIYVSM